MKTHLLLSLLFLNLITSLHEEHNNCTLSDPFSSSDDLASFQINTYYLLFRRAPGSDIFGLPEEALVVLFFDTITGECVLESLDFYSAAAFPMKIAGGSGEPFFENENVLLKDEKVYFFVSRGDLHLVVYDVGARQLDVLANITNFTSGVVEPDASFTDDHAFLISTESSQYCKISKYDLMGSLIGDHLLVSGISDVSISAIDEDRAVFKVMTGGINEFYFVLITDVEQNLTFAASSDSFGEFRVDKVNKKALLTTSAWFLVYDVSEAPVVEINQTVQTVADGVIVSGNLVDNYLFYVDNCTMYKYPYLSGPFESSEISNCDNPNFGYLYDTANHFFYVAMFSSEDVYFLNNNQTSFITKSDLIFVKGFFIEEAEPIDLYVVLFEKGLPVSLNYSITLPGNEFPNRLQVSPNQDFTYCATPESGESTCTFYKFIRTEAITTEEVILTSTTPQKTTTSAETQTTDVYSTTHVDVSSESEPTFNCPRQVNGACLPGECISPYFGFNCEETSTQDDPIEPFINCAIPKGSSWQFYFGYSNPNRIENATQTIIIDNEETNTNVDLTRSHFNFAYSNSAQTSAEWRIEDRIVSFLTVNADQVICPTELFALLQIRFSSPRVISSIERDKIRLIISEHLSIPLSYVRVIEPNFQSKKRQSNPELEITVLSTNNTEAADSMENLVSSFEGGSLTESITTLLSDEADYTLIPFPTGVDYTVTLSVVDEHTNTDSDNTMASEETSESKTSTEGIESEIPEPFNPIWLIILILAIILILITTILLAPCTRETLFDCDL